MIIIIGLIILVAAVVAGVAGVLSNVGHAHTLTQPFAVLGYHVTGTTGTLFLYGIVVGALALLGLSLLLAGARRASRRGHEARRGLTQSRRETAAVTQDRDDLIDQRETARAYSAGTPGNGVAHDSRDPAKEPAVPPVTGASGLIDKHGHPRAGPARHLERTALPRCRCPRSFAARMVKVVTVVLTASAGLRSGRSRRRRSSPW